MKHVPLTLSKFRAPVIKTYLSDLFKGLLRTTWQFPKTIWYSQRYNAGEKFLMNVPYLYPYKYEVLDKVKSKEPVHTANNLNSSLENLQALFYEKNYLNSPNAAKIGNQNEFLSNYNKTFFELYKSFEYNIENPRFDIPVAVCAKTLYGAAYFEGINNFEGNSFKEMEASEIKPEVLEFILKKFLQKIQNADAESISQVMFCLDKFNHYPVDIWNVLIQEQSQRSFEPEFTKVRPHFPIFYRYQEVSNNQFSSLFLDEKGNQLFLHGTKAVYETYNSVSKAAYKNSAIQGNDYIKHLEEKFKYLNLKENEIKLA
jgi:hypothetical protein